MRFLSIAWVFTVWCCTAITYAQSPPANDNCANPLEIYLGTTSFSTEFASTDGNPYNECQIDDTGVADLDGDGDVDVADLLLLIAAWGACPS